MLKAQKALCLVARTLLRQPGLPAISQRVLVDDSLANMEPEDILVPKESFRSGSHRDHSALLLNVLLKQSLRLTQCSNLSCVLLDLPSLVLSGYRVRQTW